LFHVTTGGRNVNGGTGSVDGWTRTDSWNLGISIVIILPFLHSITYNDRPVTATLARLMHVVVVKGGSSLSGWQAQPSKVEHTEAGERTL